MLLYYAIISFCLTDCSNMDEIKRYIHSEPISYAECIMKVEEMTSIIREIIPDIAHRPISQLCVQKLILKNIESYEVFNGY